MNLEQTSASLLEQFPGKERLDLKHEEKLLEKFGKVVFTGFGIIIAIAILSFIYLIMTKMALSGTEPLAGIMLMAFIVFACLSLGYVFWQESLKEKRQKIEITLAHHLDSPQTGKLLPETEIVPVPSSIVEDTTELLHKKKPNNTRS